MNPPGVLHAHTKSAEETQCLAAGIADSARPGDVLILVGDLGAGKTVFVKGFAEGLGITDAITSPTFVLMRNHSGGRIPLVHLDVYRLEHLQEALDLGLAEVLDEGAIGVVEWGDLVSAVLPADLLEVRLSYGQGDDDRDIRVRATGPRWSARMRAVHDAIERWLVEPQEPEC